MQKDKTKGIMMQTKTITQINIIKTHTITTITTKDIIITTKGIITMMLMENLSAVLLIILTRIVYL